MADHDYSKAINTDTYLDSPGEIPDIIKVDQAYAMSVVERKNMEEEIHRQIDCAEDSGKMIDSYDVNIQVDAQGEQPAAAPVPTYDQSFPSLGKPDTVMRAKR